MGGRLLSLKVSRRLCGLSRSEKYSPGTTSTSPQIRRLPLQARAQVSVHDGEQETGRDAPRGGEEAWGHGILDDEEASRRGDCRYHGRPGGRPV